jgi:hypothetical protein
MRLAAVLLLLTGCGGFVDGFRKGFDRGFDKNFQASCVESAVRKGVDKGLAEKYCTCAAGKFKELKSIEKAVEACAPK